MLEFLEDKNVMVAFSFSGNPFINLNEEWNGMTELSISLCIKCS